MSENYNHNRTNRIIGYERGNITARISLLGLYAQKFSSMKIYMFTVYH